MSRQHFLAQRFKQSTEQTAKVTSTNNYAQRYKIRKILEKNVLTKEFFMS